MTDVNNMLQYHQGVYTVITQSSIYGQTRQLQYQFS